MLVAGWDFVVDGAWHGHMASMRGVEEGFSVARAAKNVLLTVSDNRGRIVGEQRSDASAFWVLLVKVPTEHPQTVYQLAGDWFVWLTFGILGSALVRMLKTRPQSLP
jgi:apolipoprotein N-acyltransferase